MSALLDPPSPREIGVLFSFHYYQKVNLDSWLGGLPYRPAVFVDSGGFSAHTQGAEIDLRAYVDWIRSNSIIDHYANLDVIGDAAGTAVNQRRMEAMGMRPLPVTHVGSSPEHIARYADQGYAYQCLGGMVPHLRGVGQAIKQGRHHLLLDWLDQCFEVGARYGVMFHGFGATAWGVMQRYPWRSVDSSSWASGYRYGQAMLFDYRRARWHSLQIGDRAGIMRVAGLVRAYGANPLSLVADDRRSRLNIIRIAARSWLAAQRHLQAQQGAKLEAFYSVARSNQRITKGLCDDLSPRVYLADANSGSRSSPNVEVMLRDMAKDTPRVYLVDGAVDNVDLAVRALNPEEPS